MIYKNLIFDFDGVLAESNEIRFNGFRLLFKEFPENQVDELVIYAKTNGGISRYEKIDYFFQKIRGESVSEDKVQNLAAQFSDIVRQDVIKAEPVKGSVEFLKKNFSKFNFALVSGSDQAELRVVCRERRIDHFFKMILGSPVKKEDNIAQLLESLRWRPDETVYIGDSNNDLEASQGNSIDFIGRDSGLVDWGCLGITRILDLSELEGILGSTK
jgi:phosphoglycolate phosphatase-like HAD superfamily hydrolase